MDLMWILVGGTHDSHTGSRQTYALIEYHGPQLGLAVSDFRNDCNFWTSIQALNSYQSHAFQQLLAQGKRFLCQGEGGGGGGRDHFGYRDAYGVHPLGTEENREIQERIMTLLYRECIRQ